MALRSSCLVTHIASIKGVHLDFCRFYRRGEVRGQAGKAGDLASTRLHTSFSIPGGLNDPIGRAILAAHINLLG